MKDYLIIGFLTISLLLCGGFIVKMKLNEMQTQEVTSELNKKLMEANLEIGRAETKFGDASKHIKYLEKDLKKEIKKRNSLLTRYGELKARYEVEISRSTETSIEISNSININDCKELDLLEGQLYVATNKELGVLNPFTAGYKDHRLLIGCSIGSRLTSSGTLPVDISYNLTLKLRAEIVEAITPSGAVNNYIRLYELDDKGITVGKFEVESFAMVIDDQRTPKFLWWDPHMDMGVGLGLRGNSSIDSLNWEGLASVGFSPISYGLSSKDLAWRFARISLDVGQEISVGLTPVLYNLGNNLPIFTNLWLGPFGHYGLADKQWGFGMLLGATL
jgi:hypothetical protein